MWSELYQSQIRHLADAFDLRDFAPCAATLTTSNRKPRKSPKAGSQLSTESVARSKRQGAINVVYIPDRISHCPTICGGTNHSAGQITRRRKADRLWAINPRKPSTSSRRRSRSKPTNQNCRSSRLCSRNNPAIKSSKACGPRQRRRKTAEVMRFSSRAMNGVNPPLPTDSTPPLGLYVRES